MLGTPTYYCVEQFFLSRVDPDPRGTARTDEDHGVALAIEDKSDVRGALPFTPITLAFQNVKYAVDVKEDKKKARKPLLRGINGFAKPGTLTALMGSSGGKAALLHCFALFCVLSHSLPLALLVLVLMHVWLRCNSW